MSKLKCVLCLIVVVLILSSSFILADGQKTEIVKVELANNQVNIEQNQEFDPASIITGGNYDKLDLPIVDTSQAGQQHLIYHVSKGVSSLEMQVVLNVMDKNAPTFVKKAKRVTADFDEKGLDLTEFFEASDEVDGKLEVKITGDYNLKKAGIYKLVASATDKSNNTITHEFELLVKEEPKKEEKKSADTKAAEKAKTTNNKTNDKTNNKTNNNQAKQENAPADNGGGVNVRLTRYGFDCGGCSVNSQGFSHSASGVAFSGNAIRQNDGSWQEGYTYHGYYVFAANSKYPLCTTFLLYDHPYSGSGIVQGQPIKGIVLDRGGLPEDLFDLFVGSEHNLDTVRNVGSSKSARLVVTGQATRTSNGCSFK